MNLRFKLTAAGLLAALVFAGSLARGDSLIFKGNNDRLKGRWLAEEGDTVVFETERFGVMRVPLADVTVTRETDFSASQNDVKAEAVVVDAPQHPPADHAAMADTSADAVQLVMASDHDPARTKVPWHVRLAFSTELIEDSAKKSEVILELRVERKWDQNELRFEPRYEYRSERGRTTADLLKVKSYYRHDFGRWWFVQYLPYYELNRQFTFNGAPLDYQYFRNEFGGGIRVIDRPGSILRVGVAESFYNIFLLDYSSLEVSLRSESVFIEAELDLPWRVSLRDRGQILRYSKGGGGQGMRNDLEITKHLNDFWWIGLRHEYSVNSPELQGADISKLRLFLGVDF